MKELVIKKVTLVNLGSVVPLAMFLILTFLFLPKALHCFSCFCMSVESIERVVAEIGLKKISSDFSLQLFTTAVVRL